MAKERQKQNLCNVYERDGQETNRTVEHPPGSETRFHQEYKVGEKWLKKKPANFEPPLFHRTEWLSASKQDRKLIVEGEKDVRSMEKLGFVVTTIPEGASGNWLPSHTQDCTGDLIAIFCDHDQPGERHGQKKAQALSGKAGQVKLVFLNSDLPKGTDVTDLIEKHKWTAKDFHALIDKTPAFVPKETGSQIIAKKMSDIEPVPVHWTWPYRFAEASFSLVVGNPGVGKSFLSLDMAARVSTGAYWPDSNNLPGEAGRAPKGSVVLLTSEDGLANTVRPRLDKMQAEPKKIYAIEGVHLVVDEREPESSTDGELSITDEFDLSRDIALLEKKLKQIEKVKLIIIDPLSAYYGTKIDTHRNAAIRSVLTPLAKLAERHNVCVIGITHLRKSVSEAAIYRVTGSIGQTGQARAAWMIHKDKENKDRRLFVCLKNNLSPETTGLAFQINDGRVEYEQDVITDSAEDIFRDESEHGPSVQEATECLLDLFEINPNPKQKDVLKEARKLNISDRTLYRAKAALNIKSVQHPSGFWRWEKPEEKDSHKSENRDS